MKYLTVPVTAFEQNCSLVFCENSGAAIAIDPGGEIEKIMSIAKNNKLNIEKIVLTHGHIDHVGGAANLASQLNIPISGPQLGDRFLIESLSTQSQMFGFEDVESFEPDEWLNDGDIIRVGTESLKVIHTPGHTPGHISLFHQESDTAFVGDVLFYNSIGRTDFPGGDHTTLLHSIKERLFPLGDLVTFIPGHGPNSTFGYERAHNPFL